MIRLVAAPNWAPKAWRPALGQAADASATNLKVVVIDAAGNPVNEALVTVGSASAYTDAAGVARLSTANPGALRITATFGDYVTTKLAQWESADMPLYVAFPVIIRTEAVRTPELIAFVAGLGLIGAGYVWKLDPLKIVGELVTGAIVFAMIYRLAGR
jgi:hypothetical protein